jgi:hypothetical protein
MNYSRDNGESVQDFRGRILKTWRRLVGPLAEKKFVRSRMTLLNLADLFELSAALDLLASMGAIPKRRKKLEDCWMSRPFNITAKEQWPTREEVNEVDIPGFDPSIPQEGFLAISWYGRHRGPALHKSWGEWQRVGKSPETWDWMWPDHTRLYQFLRALRDNRRNYEFTRAKLRWCPYPPGIDKAEVMHGNENCAIAILKARYAAKARALEAIQLTDAGGFGLAQMHEAAKVLKLNLQLRDRLEGIMLETKKEDGGWLYNGKTRHGKPVPPVVLYNYDGHARGAMPSRPKVTEADVDAVEEVGSYHAMRRWYGPDAVIWPSAEGYIIDCMGEHIVRRAAKSYEPVQKRAEELGVSSFALTSTPFGVEVAAWREINRFSPTPRALAPAWKAANFFPRPYCLVGAKVGPTADINSAYESAPTAGAKDLFARYGFPEAEGQLVVQNPPASILKETGLVVATLSLEKCHPWVQYLVAEPRGVYTTMRLQAWLEAGAVEIERIELAVVARRYYPSLERPEEARYSPKGEERWSPGGDPTYSQTKHWGREAIGRLIPNGDKHQDLFYIADDAEAASVIQTLREREMLTSFVYEKPTPVREQEDDLEQILAELNGAPPLEPENDEPGLWRIGYSDTALPKTSCFHAHAYWLDYSALVVDREVFRHPWEAIVRVAVDSITLAKGHSFSENVIYGLQPGQWKEEPHKEKVWAKPSARPVPDLTEALALAGPYWAPICGSAPVLHVLEAPAGYGKTTACHAGLKGHRFVSLTPTCKMRKKFEAEGVSALTWRWALRPYDTFKPEAVRVKPGSIIHIAEIGLWPSADVEEIIPWLLENGYRVIADGHRYQQAPVMGEEPWKWLDYNPLVTIEQFQSRDYRSKEEPLAALKMRMMAQTNAVALCQLKKAVGETSYASFLEKWHPRDYVYAALHEVRDTLHAEMGRIHQEKYPDEPVRIVYGEKDRKRTGEEEFIPLGAPIPENAKLAYVTTYSSCQGETASEDSSGYLPRVWLVEARATDFFKYAIYTAAGRTEYMAQLGVVVGVPVKQRNFPKKFRLSREQKLAIDYQMAWDQAIWNLGNPEYQRPVNPYYVERLKAEFKAKGLIP